MIRFLYILFSAFLSFSLFMSLFQEAPSDLYILHTYASHPLPFPLPMTVMTSYSFSYFYLFLSRSVLACISSFFFPLAWYLWHLHFTQTAAERWSLEHLYALGSAHDQICPGDSWILHLCMLWILILFIPLVVIWILKGGGNKKAKKIREMVLGKSGALQSCLKKEKKGHDTKRGLVSS